jgi:hypothetical protein
VKIGSIDIRRMGKHNQALHFWFDVYFRGQWYVISWRKKSRPYCYASEDATPPCADNNGRWLFGRNRYGY